MRRRGGLKQSDTASPKLGIDASNARVYDWTGAAGFFTFFAPGWVPSVG